MEQPFTQEEQEIMALLVQAHNKMVQLKASHESELKTWCHHLHGMQSVLNNRVVRRLYPNYYNNF